MSKEEAKKLFEYWSKCGYVPGVSCNIYFTLTEENKSFLNPYFNTESDIDWANGLKVFCNLRMPFKLNIELRSEWSGDSMWVVDEVPFTWNEFEYDGFKEAILNEVYSLIAY